MRYDVRTLHLFAGAGGGLLADLILGHEPVCAVEWDAYCCQVLRERASEGWFPNLQVFEGDVRMFPASDWKGRVDCIHAGFPCPPFSVAGKRKGATDERNMWPATARIIGEVRPSWVFLENVAGLVSSQYGWTVLSDLSRLGYDARWTVLGADQVGAPHRRDRWFLLANAKGGRDGRDGEWTTREGQPDRASQDASSTRGAGLAGSQQHGTSDKGGAGAHGPTAEFREDVANAKCVRLERPEFQSNVETNGDNIISRSGYEGWWSVEPDLGRVAHGVASRVDRLKALGNGQVALQAALAWTLLKGER